MAAMKKNGHLTLEERKIIETGIYNGSTKTAISKTLGKDNSTIGKEIKNHRKLTYKYNLPLECSNYQHCSYGRKCYVECPNYKPFKCTRRDVSPGACNGCEKYTKCRFNKYRYNAFEANSEYQETLVSSRAGVNATVNEIRALGELIKPLIENGQSIYAILQNHPEIDCCEKTLYNYIESGVFQDAGVSITPLDLKMQVKRKLPKAKRTEYSPRKDKSYLKGRKYEDLQNYLEINPDAYVVEMDTVYNDVSKGPFIQTFKFLKYDLLICIYQEAKDSQHMLNGILLLEEILGESLFSKEVEVLKTDRGSEFIFSDEAELRKDGSRRTRIFYCDAMASWQKGSLENVHLLLREICPKGVDLFALGVTGQSALTLVASHINSYKKEKLNGKSSFQLLEFLNPLMMRKLLDFGMCVIAPDEVILKPFLLKK